MKYEKGEFSKYLFEKLNEFKKIRYAIDLLNETKDDVKRGIVWYLLFDSMDELVYQFLKDKGELS